MRIDATGVSGPDVVWGRYTHPSSWPTWAPQINDHGVDELESGCRAWADVPAPYLPVLPYSPLAALALRRLVGG